MSNGKVTKNLVAAIVIMALAAGLVYVFYSMRPATKKRRPKRVVPIVEAVTLNQVSEDIHIEAAGVVVPARELVLYSEVEGKIVYMNEQLVPGGIVKKGERIVSIDPEEYILRINELKAGIAEAESKLELEEGQQTVAREEWKIFEKENVAGESNKGLALREPHLKSAKAQLDAAKSRLHSAELDLKKTRIVSPLNGIVIEEFAEKGQYVGRQGKIATLVGTDYFRIRASIPLKNLYLLKFPQNKNDKGSGDERGRCPQTVLAY